MTMKNLCILLSVLFCMVGLSAEVPQNVRATAISYDGFTLRWDPVGGAEEYQVEVKEAVYDVVFKTDFEGLTSFPEGWLTSDYAGVREYDLGAYSGTNLAYLSALNASITTPFYLNPRMFKFWARTSGDSADVSITIRSSDDLENWFNLWVISTTSSDQGQLVNGYQDDPFVYEPDNKGRYSLQLIFSKRGTSTTVFFDDFSITAIQPDSSSSFYSVGCSNTGLRISGTQPEAEYIYRVKPMTNGGEFSEWSVVETTSYNPSQNTGSAIAGAAAVIPVSIGDTTHSVTIDPADDDIDADYSVSLSQEASIYKYNISCEDNSALNGVYIISHPGFQASSVNVTGAGVYSYDTSVVEQTTLWVSSISAKGNLEIDLGLEESTLPVTLSNFSVVAIARDVCRIDWITQSESNLIGFYILRGSVADVAEAQLISALIPARNSSTIQQYSYLDHAPFYPAYYWLMTMEISGQEIINGPVYAEYEGGQTETSTEYQDQVRIFPNPFSYEATLQISVAQNQEVAYKLYNIKGEYIRKEEIGVLAKGIHPITFNAINGEGKPLGTGQYILEMQFGKETCLQKLMIIK